MPSRYGEADLSRLRRVSIDERGGMIDVGSFVRPGDTAPDVAALMETVPDLFAGSDLRRAVDALVEAVSSSATGESLSAVTLTVTVAVSVRSPSETV